ncbi:MAG: hypothetical protein WC998_02020 [Candidatus Paceibacterota bacterium]|jgi:hypothetical protein
MQSRSLNIGRFFKASAVLVVFTISISIPLGISFSVQESARNVRIMMDMRQIRDWAEVHQLGNKNYKGFEDNSELKRVFKDIEDMGGKAYIFVAGNYNSYCIKVDFKKGSRCIDNSGYIGKDNRVCSSYITRCN